MLPKFAAYLFLPLFALGLCLPGMAPAQSDTSYKKLTPAMISLVHAPGSEDKFFLRVTSRYGQAGCQRVGKVDYKKEFQDIYLDIAIEGYEVDKSDQPLHPEYQCSSQSAYPSADIPLSVSELKSNATRQIRFNTLGDVAYYDVILGDHSVKLEADISRPVSKSYQPMELPGVIDPLKLWLYPKSTIILRPSGQVKSASLKDRMDRLARSRGLTPLESVIEGFRSPLEDPSSFYYVDTGHKRSARMADGAALGTIQVPASFYGAYGNESMDRPVQVFAHVPGPNE